jgi:hypothetical protein
MEHRTHDEVRHDDCVPMAGAPWLYLSWASVSGGGRRLGPTTRGIRPTPVLPRSFEPPSQEGEARLVRSHRSAYLSFVVGSADSTGTFVTAGDALVLWSVMGERATLHAMRSPLFRRSRFGCSTAKQNHKHETFHNLDEDEQRAFWVRGAQYIWTAREIERRCPLQASHPEHNYRYDSTPGHIMYWCRGHD